MRGNVEARHSLILIERCYFVLGFFAVPLLLVILRVSYVVLQLHL